MRRKACAFDGDPDASLAMTLDLDDASVPDDIYDVYDDGNYDDGIHADAIYDDGDRGDDVYGGGFQDDDFHDDAVADMRMRHGWHDGLGDALDMEELDVGFHAGLEDDFEDDFEKDREGDFEHGLGDALEDAFEEGLEDDLGEDPDGDALHALYGEEGLGDVHGDGFESGDPFPGERAPGRE